MSGRQWLSYYICVGTCTILICVGDVHSAESFGAAACVIAALGRRA